MTLIDQQEALSLLRNAKNILIAPSSPVDGDSLGSSLSLMAVLQKMGKQVTVVSYDPVPDYLKFLPYLSQIKPELPATKDFVISLRTDHADVDHLKYQVEQGRINIIVTPKSGQFSSGDLSFVSPEAQFDLIVTVDTGDIVQLGKLYENHKSLFHNTPLLNIDHHASNGKFGTHNYLEIDKAATTQMVFPLLQAFEQERGEELIDEDVATLLLVGIITDTGSFQHSNTSPEAFEAAADLLERGARQQEIIKHIFKTKSLATLKLWGRVLLKMQYDKTIHLVYSTLSLKDFEETGASPDDTGGIIDELMSNAPGAEVVMLLKEKEPGYLSGSLRAPNHLADVSEIAQKLGGGGHKKAAGYRIRGKSLEEGLKLSIDTIASYMGEKLEHAGESGRLFPGLVTKLQNTIPVPSPGGEDLLLKDFRNRQKDPVEERVKEKSAHFFQDADGLELSK